MNRYGMKKFVAFVLAMGLVLPACKSNNVSSKILGGADVATGTPTLSTALAGLTSYISGVSSGGTNAVPQNGTIPSGTAAGLNPTVAGNTGVINGGSSQLSLVTAQAFRYCNVAVSNLAAAPAAAAPSAAQSIAGYYLLALPADATTLTLDLNIGQALPGSFHCFVTLQDASGNIGPIEDISITQVATVGTGDVQVSLSWDTKADIDLHVVDPNNVEVWYGDKAPTTTKGTLDLDSNVGCPSTGISNENITWPTGTAVAGTYIVRVDNYNDCSLGTASNCVITVRVAGVTKTFAKTFAVNSDDAGGAGSGVEICRFTNAGAFSAPQPNLTRSIGTKPAVCQ
ncbi:MAG TPA: hypothetical protein P5079_02835 [Elusimicrobiota bacterium]|nr:hypothetical protein [Elusimicrobiota bacterium]